MTGRLGRRGWLVGLVAGSCLGRLSGCGAGAAPLGTTPDESDTACSPLRGVPAFTLGDDVLRNGSSQSLIVDQVRLVDPVNMSLVGSSLIPIAGGPNSLLGSRPGYPPRLTDAFGRRQWASRRPAVHAIIPVSVRGSVQNLIVGVHIPDPSRQASAQHIQVTYRDLFTTSWTWTSNIRYVLAPGSRCRS
jgi:hypothetical protein